LARRPKSDPLEFLTTLSSAQLDRLEEDVLRGHKTREARKVYGISQASENIPQPDEPDEFAIALRKVKAKREQMAKLVAAAIEKNQKARKYKKVYRRKLKLTKFHIALFTAAGLTEIQEKYLRLRLEYGLRPTAIAHECGVHPSTVQESLRAAHTKIKRARSNPQNARLLGAYLKNS
jgi:predicted DNA binding protein